MARAPASPAVAARMIHASLMTGVLLLAVVAWVMVRGHAGTGLAPRGTNAMLVPLGAIAAAAFLGAFVVARRLPPVTPGQAVDDWWRSHLGLVVVVWALAEAPALLGAVLYLTGGDQRALIATLGGLALFLHFSPGRLAGRT